VKGYESAYFILSIAIPHSINCQKNTKREWVGLPKGGSGATCYKTLINASVETAEIQCNGKPRIKLYFSSTG
jgi:hypothetical protein